MASLKKKKFLGAPWANETEMVRVVYDFALDGGGVATYEALEAQSVMGARLVGLYVLGVVTSGGSMTVDVGINGGAEYLSSAAVATLTAGAYLSPVTQNFTKLAVGDSLDIKLEVAAALGGKIELIFEVIKLA